MTTDRFDKLWGYFFGLYERIFDEGNSYDDSIAVISLIIKNFWDANYENKLSENPNTLEKLVFNYYKQNKLDKFKDISYDYWSKVLDSLILRWGDKAPAEKKRTDPTASVIMQEFAYQLKGIGNNELNFIDPAIGTGSLLKGLIGNIIGQDIDFRLRSVAEANLSLKNTYDVKISTGDSLDINNDIFKQKGIFIFDPPFGKKQKKPSSWEGLETNQILGTETRENSNTEIIFLVNFLLFAEEGSYFVCKMPENFLTIRDKEIDVLRKYLIEKNLLCVVKNPEDSFVTLVGTKSNELKPFIVLVRLNSKLVKDNRIEEIANHIIEESNTDDMVGFLEKIISPNLFSLQNRGKLINETKGNIIELPSVAYAGKSYDHPIVYYNKIARDELEIIKYMQSIKDKFIELKLNQVLEIEEIPLEEDIPEGVEPVLTTQESVIKEETKEELLGDIYRVQHWFNKEENSNNPIAEALAEVYPFLTSIEGEVNKHETHLYLKNRYIARNKYKTFFNYLKKIYEDNRACYLFYDIEPVDPDLEESTKNIIRVDLKEEGDSEPIEIDYREFIMPKNFQRANEISIPFSLLSEKQQEIYTKLCSYWFDYKSFKVKEFEKYADAELYLAFKTMYELGLIINLNENNIYIESYSEIYDEYRPFHPLIEEDFR